MINKNKPKVFSFDSPNVENKKEKVNLKKEKQKKPKKKNNKKDFVIIKPQVDDFIFNDLVDEKQHVISKPKPINDKKESAKDVTKPVLVIKKSKKSIKNDLIEFQDISNYIDNQKLNSVDYCVKDEPMIHEKNIKLDENKELEKPIISENKPLELETNKKDDDNFLKKEFKDNINENKINEINNLIDDEPLLEVIDLKKQYTRKAKPAIDKLNFKVLRGEFHAFVGANGAGKTTTIKSIVGAYANFEGKVKISGVDNHEKLSKAKLGYIPEIARFPSRISTYDYLKSMAMLNRLTSKEADEFVKKILIEFKMYDLKNVSPNKFSSGQKKKILLAQALSNDPDILIMDEPAANLDPKARIDFFNILKNLQKKGKSIFISSHILSELDLYADSLTILDGGKIVFTGKRNNEEHKGNKYAFRVNLLKKGDFGKNNIGDFTIEQDDEEPRNYIISSNNKEKLDDFLGNLFKSNKASKIEVYKLTIEDMYKKYVVLGSVHTGYKLNANSTIEKDNIK